jgi:hypothetical protein
MFLERYWRFKSLFQLLKYRWIVPISTLPIFRAFREAKVDNYGDLSNERRRHERIGLEAQVSIKSMKKRSMMLGWIQDISHGGCQVRVDIPLNFMDFFHDGDKVLFETFVDFFRLKGRGNICWTSTGKDRVGIKFEELDLMSKRHLEGFLKMFS